MTPEELAPYIEQAKLVPDQTICTIDIAILRALCDALEQAWAERDRHRADSMLAQNQRIAQSIRAQRAESALDGMRLAFDVEMDNHTRALAALARVRALCEDPNTLSPTSLYWDHIHPDDLRAAIEGDSE